MTNPLIARTPGSAMVWLTVVLTGVASAAEPPKLEKQKPAQAATEAAQIEPPPPGSGTGATALTWTTPKGWVSVPPSTPMRKAQFKVPGSGGDADLAVFYFGPNEGGGAIPNTQRWASQFVLANGHLGFEAMKTKERKVGTIDVYTVETAGTFMGDMSIPGPKTDYMLFGAVARGPDANWFFKMVGPRTTMEEQRKSFEELIDSLKSPN